jgi:hypothetical protein
MNNEPVAWINQNIDIENGKPQLAWQKDNFAEIFKPLYTHPAKTLTDEEIWKELTTVKHTWIATTSVWFEFEKEELTKAIRAILRKAQEK